MVDLFIDPVETASADALTRVTAVLGLCLSLGSSLVVVTQVASLAHTHGVVQSLTVMAVPGHLVTAKLTVARGTHVLGVVLSMHMRALGDLHLISSVLGLINL